MNRQSKIGPSGDSMIGRSGDRAIERMSGSKLETRNSKFGHLCLLVFALCLLPSSLLAQGTVSGAGTISGAGTAKSAAGGGGIALDHGSDSGPKTATSTVSWSFTVGSGLTNSLLVVTTGAASTTNVNYTVPSSVTFAGNSLTQAVGYKETGAGNYASVWYMVSPPATTGDIVITLGGACDTAHGDAVLLTGVNPSTPLDGTNSGPVQSLTITTTVSGDWIVDAASVGTANGGRVNGFGSGQTPLYPTSGTDTQGASYIGPLEPAGDHSTSFTNSGFTQHAYVNVAFRPAP